ncbi:MAG: 2-oxoacid:ferredoxin oxidoreductase subunit gamma [Syntrophomonadaceae bacterium]|jgi:2-oxoglutarate ferredoxin oxidoreductase subunit gamma|nr:2-oxoacid:ferredoxin oxidoreductase subunit gamma [Syntrophomonadaceae bacterium]
MRKEVILAGSGGQGLVLGGVILGEAAMLEGKNVVQTQSYGIATRGGFSQSEVIISDEEIIFQQVEKADVILTLTQETMDMYKDTPDAVILYDSDLIEAQSGPQFHGYPFTKMAIELGNAGTLNVIALGFISALTNIVTLDSLRTVLTNRFGKKAALNLKALQKGVDLASSLNQKEAIS